MMNLIQACGVIAAQRSPNSVLVATMGAMFAFDRLDEEQGVGPCAPSRLSSVPLMGGAAGLGLGLALARPDRQVIVVDGDASLMMELGVLASVAAVMPANFLHVVIHNGTQFSGLANLGGMNPRQALAPMALACGYRHAHTLANASEWDTRFGDLLAQPGPGFVELMVEAPAARTAAGFEQPEIPDRQFQRMGQEAQALQAWLRSGAAA